MNSCQTGDQAHPSVASDAEGNFVVVWWSAGQDGHYYGIFGQRYDSAGGTLGSEFRVNSHTTSDQQYPSVASDAARNVVVLWRSFAQDGDNYGVLGQPTRAAGA